MWLAWPRAGRPAGYAVAAVTVLVLIGASDVLDGFLARRYGLTSRTGVVLDAAADKLAQVAAAGFFTLVVGRLPLWFFILLVARDLLVASGTLVVLRLRPGARLAHRVHGKGASFLLFLLLLCLTAGFSGSAVTVLLGASATLVAVSTLAYVVEGVLLVRERRGHQPRG